MPFQLTNKTALVTGAGSGIGAAIAETFARSGATVFVTDINPAAAAETAARIVGAGGSATALSPDVRHEEACRAVSGTTGTVDILVNNAGIGHAWNGPANRRGRLDRLYAINVRGVFNVTKAYLPDMVARRAGAHRDHRLGRRARRYTRSGRVCTTKFAVVGLTKSMALDHAADGVRINCICPGRVETPFVSARLREYPDPELAYKEMASTQSMGRMGRPEEIAAVALFLASDEASFITGSALTVDGGWKG